MEKKRNRDIHVNKCYTSNAIYPQTTQDIMP